jgi:hypothetical protein
MQSFHFDESYATRRRKHLSFPYAQCPKIFKLININILQEMRQRDCTPIHDSCPPPAMRGKNFQNLRPKNAKNHAISLLQMQGCPQSNIKQEIKTFCFKETLKEIENHFKTKTTQTKFLF